MDISQGMPVKHVGELKCVRVSPSSRLIYAQT